MDEIETADRQPAWDATAVADDAPATQTTVHDAPAPDAPAREATASEVTAVDESLDELAPNGGGTSGNHGNGTAG